jgi:hypothetical protein
VIVEDGFGYSAKSCRAQPLEAGRSKVEER